MAKTNAIRFNDYIYDPLFVVSGEKDYYKAAVQANKSSIKFAICPIFPNMFSDLPQQPRYQLVARRTDPIPQYDPLLRQYKPHQQSETRMLQKLTGSERHKFFQMPISKPNIESIPEIVCVSGDSPRINKKKKTVIQKHSKKIQTQYRESSAQTTPWQPPDYTVVDDGEPELLMLDFLKWGSGLPPGMHEVQLIERARMKRAWEQSLPATFDEKSLEKRRRLIEALECNEWAFREQEIQSIHDLRLELLRQMLNELHQKTNARTEAKMKMLCNVKLAEKEAKLKSLRHKADRELRKLNFKNHGVVTKYKKVNIIIEHADRKSELYAPLMRHGSHPKRHHQIIDEHLKQYQAQYLGVEHMPTLPRWLEQATKVKEHACVKLPGTRLCIRETKWTTPILKQLHEELKLLRKEPKHHCKLLVRVAKETSEVSTPQIEVEVGDKDEEIYQATVLIQSVLRGRASQMLIFEGRDRCRELINELRSTHSLEDQDKAKRLKERFDVQSQQRENLLCNKNIGMLHEMLQKLSGNIVGTLLDFLNKELQRLLEERRIHAMCILFERDRNAREAGEAGRRQTELRRRLEHDEMFKQVVKVHQDTVDVYLQDIITEGMDFTSHADAKMYIESLAKKVDEEAYETLEKSDFHEKEELVANLVHNFLLPEVEKQLVRSKLKKQQHVYLQTAHDAIYNEIEELPRPSPTLEKPKKKQRKQKPKATGDLQKTICVNSFDDLDLGNIRYGGEDDFNILYTYISDSRYGDRVSEVYSVMEKYKYDERSSCQETTDLDVDFNLQRGNLNLETHLDLRELHSIDDFSQYENNKAENKVPDSDSAPKSIPYVDSDSNLPSKSTK